MDSNCLGREGRDKTQESIRRGPFVHYFLRVPASEGRYFLRGNCHELTGYSESDFRTGLLSFRDLIHPDDFRQVTEQIDSFVGEARGPFKLIYRIRCADGASREVLDRGNPVYDMNGILQGVCGFLVNKATYSTYEDLVKRERLTSIAHTTDRIAHDVNNLLGVVVSNLDLLERKLEGDDKSQRCLSRAITAATRMSEYAASLLGFSRQRLFSTERVDVNAVVRKVWNEKSTELSARGAVGELCLSDDLWPCETDPEQLENALLVLLSNAIDAVQMGEKIMLRTQNERRPRASFNDFFKKPVESVLIQVIDRGRGMSLLEQEHCIDPFFTTKGASGAKGIGLSRVFGFSQRCRGSLDITSVQGKGTRVDLSLPRLKEQCAEEKRTLLTRKADETVE